MNSRNVPLEELMDKLFTVGKTGAFQLLRRMEELQPVTRPVVDARVCSLHGERAVIFYDGPACPFCLTLDDLDFTKKSLEIAQRAFEVMAFDAAKGGN